MTSNDGLKTPYQKPKAAPQLEERRATDRLLGERMVRVEQRLQGVEESLDRTDQAIVRLHERVDELTHKFGDFSDGIHSRVSEIINDVEQSLDSHVREEEKLFTARFENILDKIDRVAEDGNRRGEDALSGIKDLKKFALMVIGGILAAVAPVVGFLIGYIPKIVHFLDKLDALK